MMKTRIILLCLASAVPVYGQDPAVELRWKFEKEKPFYQETTTETKQSMKVMGTSLTNRQKQTFVFSWTPKEQDAKNNWMMKLRIEGVVLDFDIGGVKLDFDSSKDIAANNPLADFFKAMIGSEFLLTIDPAGNVLRIEGRDDFLKRLITANQQMEPILRQLISNESLMQMAGPFLHTIPNKAVKPGDTWSRECKLNMGSVGAYETTHTYTLAGKDAKDKQLNRITVATAVKYVPPKEGVTNPLPFKIKTGAIRSSEATGNILFHPEKGRLVSADHNLRLEGKLNVDVGGMMTEVDLSQLQTTRTTLSDENTFGRR